jgi:glycine/D-amino acid oxidase-like deaminating enzyme
MSHYDFIVIGAGVIGASVAHHLAALGAKSVLVVDRGTIGAGTTSQSSGLLRTHYSVRQNVELARSSWHAFNNFPAYVEDDEASCGLVKCGYMICAPEGDKLAPLQASLDAQQGMGIEVQLLSKAEARERLPIAQFDDAALIGYEPEAGFADAYLVATGFARSARRRGVKFMENIGRHLQLRGADQHTEHLDTRARRVDRRAAAGQAGTPYGARSGVRSRALYIQHAGLQGPRLTGHAVFPQLRRQPDARVRRRGRRNAERP